MRGSSDAAEKGGVLGISLSGRQRELIGEGPVYGGLVLHTLLLLQMLNQLLLHAIIGVSSFCEGAVIR